VRRPAIAIALSSGSHATIGKGSPLRRQELKRNDVLQSFIGDESREGFAADGEKAGVPGETPRGKLRCERCGDRS